MIKRFRWDALVVALALALVTGARAQQNVVTPSTLGGFSGLSLSLGAGALGAATGTFGSADAVAVVDTGIVAMPAMKLLDPRARNPAGRSPFN